MKYAFLKSAAVAALMLTANTGPAAAAVGGPIDPVVYELMVFVMSIFVGYYVVWSVTPISSVIVVGALLAVAVEHGAVDGFMSGATLASKTFGVLALAMAAVNIFGGFLVTQRMLAMYKKKGDKR
jgi:NAD(P) transhydrogenase subunit alpha